MAEILPLKIGADGLPTEADSTNDSVTLASFTVAGGGPVVSGSGIDMNSQAVSDILNLSFNDPSTGYLAATAGNLVIDKILGMAFENSMDVGSSILFPVVADDADQLDAFRLPVIAGTPTATPADGGEGYLAWDSTNNKLYAWDGASWDDLSTVTSAENQDNILVASGAITAGQPVYISASGAVSVAQADAVSTARVIGFAVNSAADAAAVTVRANGVIDGLSGLTAGAPVYLDAAAAGGVTETVPSGTGNIIVKLGYALSATEIMIDVDQMGRRA